MSHKKKWKKRKRRAARRRSCSAYAVDRHHCLFIGRKWESSFYGSKLRRSFIYAVPIVRHRELHRLVSDVPLPPESMLAEVWRKYEAERDVVDSYGICRALAWLYVNVPDADFRRAIQMQIDFFSS